MSIELTAKQIEADMRIEQCAQRIEQAISTEREVRIVVCAVMTALMRNEALGTAFAEYANGPLLSMSFRAERQQRALEQAFFEGRRVPR